jgi:hypothetical protein
MPLSASFFYELRKTFHTSWRALSACGEYNGAALQPPDPTSAHNPGGAAVFVIILCRLL